MNSNNLSQIAEMQDCITNLIPIGLVVIEKDLGKIVYANEQAKELYGVPLNNSEIWENSTKLTKLLKLDGSVYPPEQLPINRALFNAEEAKDELIIERPDCSQVIVLASATPILSKKGKVIAVVNMLENITEQKKFEMKIERQNMIQEGVNKILSEALSSRTEEALGNVCLNVAEEITESKFGFIGEINEDGLEDISISNPGWDACIMYDQSGHKRSPNNFKIHGIYGRVLLDGKGIFTNDPPNHPDSIGLPFGHPPLESFLGIPLKNKGKTIGIIAVANREGGYSYDELKALDALTPAIVEAFMRKRAEEKVINLSKFPMENPNPVLRLDKEGIILFSNPAGCSILTEWKKKIGEKAPQEIVLRIKKAFSTKSIVDFEEHHNNLTIVLYIAPVLQEEYVNVYGINITKRKIMEDILLKTKQDLNHAQAVGKIGSWRLDTKNNVLQWSDENYRIFGIPKGTLLSYETFLETVHPEDREYVDKKWKEALIGKPYSIEHRIIVDNKIKWVWEKAEIEFDKDGNILGGFGTTQDITTFVAMREKLIFYRDHLEDLLEEKTRELKDSERLAAIGATAGMVGHDIRNPLQGIDGAVYLAKQSILSSQAKGEEKKELIEILDLINDQVKYIDYMIADLQDYAKKPEPMLKKIELAELLKESLKLVNIPDNILVNVVLPSNSLNLVADYNDIKRVFSNLFKNAVQAMPNGGELTIFGCRKNKNICIRIEDTGVGIAEDIKPHIFTPLFTTKSKGQGFGLAVCKKLVEAHGGKITFESEIGKGSTFTIRIPLKKGAEFL